MAKATSKRRVSSGEPAILPDLPIPYSAKRDENEKRYGWPAGMICLLCHKPLNDETAARWVQLDPSLGAITDPTIDSAETGGGFPIGPDCWRRNKQVHPYEVKAFSEAEGGQR